MWLRLIQNVSVRSTVCLVYRIRQWISWSIQLTPPTVYVSVTIFVLANVIVNFHVHRFADGRAMRLAQNYLIMVKKFRPFGRALTWATRALPCIFEARAIAQHTGCVRVNYKFSVFYWNATAFGVAWMVDRHTQRQAPKKRTVNMQCNALWSVCPCIMWTCDNNF